MKLYALIDEEGEDWTYYCISQLFETKQQVTDYIMNDIAERFETFKEYNSGFSEFKWPYENYNAPKISLVETNVDFNDDFNYLNYKDFIDYEHPILEQIKAYNIDMVQNGERLRKQKELEKKKEQIQKLKQEISALEHD